MVRITILTIVIIILIGASIVPTISGKVEQNILGDIRKSVPPFLEIGDILFCDIKPTIVKMAEQSNFIKILPMSGFSNDHAAMYIGRNRFIESIPYVYRPLRKNWLGVVITPYWFFKAWATNITFGHVTNTTTQDRKNAVKWGDSKTNTSEYLPNGTTYTVSHSWKYPGEYIVTVEVFDTQTTTITVNTILIHALYCGKIGYLIDEESDGIYDMFYNNETKENTIVQLDNECYLIDLNGDGSWEYMFDISKGLSSYQEINDIPGFKLGIFVIILFILLVFKRKKNESIIKDDL